jgi:hypothetical protein
VCVCVKKHGVDITEVFLRYRIIEIAARGCAFQISKLDLLTAMTSREKYPVSQNDNPVQPCNNNETVYVNTRSIYTLMLLSRKGKLEDIRVVLGGKVYILRIRI